MSLSFKLSCFTFGKRTEEEFVMKQATLIKIQAVARDGQHYPLFLDESGFCSLTPVVCSWSSRALPDTMELNDRCWRGAIDAPNLDSNCFVNSTSASVVKAPNVAGFLDTLIRQRDERPTVIVFDNAGIYHCIDQPKRAAWFAQDKVPLPYLRSSRLQLNSIESAWKHFKYRRRCFVTWTREATDVELLRCVTPIGSNS